MPITSHAPVDAFKSAQQGAWSAGDYRPLGAKMLPASEALCEAAGIRGGMRILDVATGTGNAALAAARRGCDAVGLDFSPNQLEAARARAASEGLEAEFVDGDAQSLPFPDASFDGVICVFGAMFAPDQRRVSAELLRVCRPGGTVGMANWTPALAPFFGIVAGYAPPPPDGIESPLLWGTRERLEELFAGGVSELRAEPRSITEHYSSPEAFADFYCTTFGPIVAVLAGLDDDAADSLRSDLTNLGAQHRVGDGVAASFEYLEVVAQKAS
ncbi:MAG TPA: methyltransferase domain-containing protein [Gaiellaceae bacterium]|nr:methyltransferase domain-containing protein [Gaiellaceae bacterium]